MDRLFSSDAEAYDILAGHYLDTRSGFPQDGVAKALRKLEKRLQIPDESSVFRSR
jgi:5-hydroxyisourate hydrolase-like protein (transthyretin family)